MIQDSDAGHKPVMLEELVAAVAVDRDGHYVDATYGRGGHARRLLTELSPRARLLVIDRDAEAIADADQLARRDHRVRVLRGSFGALADHLANADCRAPCAVIFDVGVSSPQLDDPGRGFSFAADGPLDMRMDQREQMTAAAWLNTADVAELESVIRGYGEERYAARVARRIAASRPLETTAQLAEVVRSAMPSVERGKHPATRVFQAVRVHINDELNELIRGLDAAFEALPVGGRLAAVTFHSLEHRLVRQRFRRWVEGPPLPRRLPVRNLPQPLARRVPTVGKGRRPSAAEVQANPRARSAFLQAVEKAVATPAYPETVGQQ